MAIPCLLYTSNPVMHKTYFLKDTMIEWQGRKYRMEIAIDSTAPMAMPSEAAGISQHEFIVNECLKQDVYKRQGEYSADAG